MKLLLTIILLYTQFIVLGQSKLDSVKIERIYNWTEIDYVTVPDSVSVIGINIDFLTKEPITGWVKFESYNDSSLSFDHYVDGVRDGFTIDYSCIDGVYIKDRFGYVQNGFEVESISYDLKKNSQTIRLFDRYYDYSLNRKIKIRSRGIKVVDDYWYYRFTKKEKKIKYSIDSLNQIYFGNYYYWNSSLFPDTIHDKEHPFSFLRFDGYYSHHIHHKEEKYCVSQFVRFYPNGKVRVTHMSGIVDTLVLWNHEDVLETDLNIIGNSFNFKVGNIEFKEGVLMYGRSILVSVRSSSNEPFRRYHYTFVSD